MMLDPPSARRLYKIAHSKRAKNFNLQQGADDLFLDRPYCVQGDDMQSALVMNEFDAAAPVASTSRHRLGG